MSALSVRLNAPVQGLEDNILRYTNSFVLFLCITSPYSSMAERQWHFQHQRRETDLPRSTISTSHIQNGVVRITNEVRRGSWPVERRSLTRRVFVVRHLGVSYASLLVTVVRRSQRSLCNSGTEVVVEHDALTIFVQLLQSPNGSSYVMLHAGLEVTNGVKYVVRTELMFRCVDRGPTPPHDPTLSQILSRWATWSSRATLLPLKRSTKKLSVFKLRFTGAASSAPGLCAAVPFAW